VRRVPVCRRLHIRMRWAGPDTATTIPTTQEVALPVCPLRMIPEAAATPRQSPALPQSLFQKFTCLIEGTRELIVRSQFVWAQLPRPVALLVSLRRLL
jgi:hypothetical protein